MGEEGKWLGFGGAVSALLFCPSDV
jgi:hypothetical protein